MSAADSVWAAVSGLPHAQRERRLIMVLQVYVDDSGMNQAPVYILAGWIMEAPRWASFSDEWDRLLWMVPRVQYFKFAEALGLGGEFSGWSAEYRDERLRLLLGLIEQYDPLGISCVVPHEEFQTLSGRLDGSFGRFFKDAYAFSFYRLIARVLRHYAGSGQEIEFIFDSQPDQMKKVLSLWDEFIENTPLIHRSLIAGPPSFKDEKKFMPLQAADLHAGWVRRLNAAAVLEEPIPVPIWGNVGEKIKRINWVMEREVMEELSAALLGVAGDHGP